MIDTPGDRAEPISDAHRWAWMRFGKPLAALDAVEREELLMRQFLDYMSRERLVEMESVRRILNAKGLRWIRQRRDEIGALEKEQAAELGRSLDRLERWANEELER
ncbi:hypothetical protein BOX37_20400 [Nocardia mangyaensis]|uniref:Uncharacterized protein n=1 Tax=Nocardia mangyaensis TaxID=2213200 RepID=A0A1J0VV21_9NOCA|nr:hypothetical protein [Nocardia mangyaensis]APE35912.1 hypothetical protein BOX37_20400 [Nocardia mangyaensis]